MIDFEYSIDEATWYYLKEGGNGLSELLDFIHEKKIGELEEIFNNIDYKDNIKKMDINNINNIKQYYDYLDERLTEIKKNILKECLLNEKEYKVINNKIDPRPWEWHWGTCDIYFLTKNRMGKKGKIYIHIGIYYANDIDVTSKGSLIECPVISIGFYNYGDNGISIEAFNEIKKNDENIDKTLDFYKEDEDKDYLMASKYINIENRENVNQAFKKIIDYAKKQLKYMYDVVNKY